MSRSPFDRWWRAKTRYAAVELFDHLLDVIYPPRCIHCRQPGTILCDRCQKNIQPAPAFALRRAGIAADRLDGVLATGLFEGALQSAIHGLKYDRKLRLSGPLADRLVRHFRQAEWRSAATIITAVPLHPTRLQQRGYNQAGLLAGRLAAAIDLPYVPQLLQRVRDTRSQVGLDYAGRQENLAGAFVATPIAPGQAIVLIDDVYTTGATLRACAAALRAAGADRVWALTVAATASTQM